MRRWTLPEPRPDLVEYCSIARTPVSRENRALTSMFASNARRSWSQVVGHDRDAVLDALLFRLTSPTFDVMTAGLW